MLLLAFWSSACGPRQDNIGKEQKASEWPVQYDSLRQSLAGVFGELDFGQPIPVQGTSYLIVPLGQWEMRQHFFQVQGVQADQRGRFTTPIALYQESYDGEFGNMILVNLQDGTMSKSFRENQAIRSLFLLQPEQTLLDKQFMLLELAPEDSIRNGKIVISSLDGSLVKVSSWPVAGWSYSPISKAVVAVLDQDEGFTPSTEFSYRASEISLIAP